MPDDLLARALENAFQRSRASDAPLSQRLAWIAEEVRALSSIFADAVERLVGRLQLSGAGQAAPRPGDPMPSFLLPDETGHLVSLEDLLLDGPVAIVFHRGHWCPYCRLNTDALARVQGEVRRHGGQLASIMPETQSFARELKQEAQAQFPILTDMDNGYALSLNLAVWVGEEMRDLISAAGWDLPTYQGNLGWMLPIPATFVLARDGRVTERFVDPDYRKRMALEDMLKALRLAA